MDAKDTLKQYFGYHSFKPFSIIHNMNIIYIVIVYVLVDVVNYFIYNCGIRR